MKGETLSVIRSREISVGIIIQSITQLDALYGQFCARTIINNCDHLLYLGGQDLETAEYISGRADKPLGGILDMPLDSMIVFERGKKPVFTKRLLPEETEKGILQEPEDIWDLLIGDHPDDAQKSNVNIPA